MSLAGFTDEVLRDELEQRALQPFKDYARAIGYSQRLLDALRQDEKWTTAKGETLRLEDMSASHVANLLAWLERRGERIHLCAEFELCLPALSPWGMGDAAQDAIDMEQDRVGEMDALTWLNEQPLVIKLRSLAAHDA